MDIFWILVAVLSLIFFIDLLLARRALKREQFCIRCDKKTTHVRDYGVTSPILAYVTAMLTFGWQTMTDQYYPFKCSVCGEPYRKDLVEKRLSELDSGREDAGGVFGNWEGMGGTQPFSSLRWYQKMAYIIMVLLGLGVLVLWYALRIFSG